MVGYLRLPQAIEHDPAAFYSHRFRTPNLVDALFGRCIRGVPPAINGLYNGAAFVLLLSQTIRCV